jgi:WD40 repeat protein
VFSPDGHSLAGADQTDVYLWNVTHPASPSPLAAPTDSANISAHAVAFSPDGHTLASSTYHGELYLWTLP